MLVHVCYVIEFFFFKQKTAYELRISDWSSDVCSSDLGLDDDPPRPPKEANGQRTIPGFNPLNWKHGDASFPERTGLRGWNWQWANPLPERIHHIARWLGDVMHEPVAVWWAAGWRKINPNMLWFVVRRRGSRQGDLPPEAANGQATGWERESK